MPLPVLSPRAQGELYSFGRNDFGQLGLGHARNVKEPQVNGRHLSVPPGVSATRCAGLNSLFVRLPVRRCALQRVEGGCLDGRRVTQISCGSFHSLALTEDGEACSFGRNNHGQLGLESREDKLAPKVRFGGSWRWGTRDLSTCPPPVCV